MKRKFFSVLVSMLLPAWVYALGLGNLELNSGLNQPFDAKIELLSATAEDLQSLNIALADSDAFERAGIDRPFLLSNLKFEVDSSGEGPAYILITSRDAIREPFLNFLLEASWSKGRLYREYTVLLDPPLYDPNVRRSQVVDTVEVEPSYDEDYSAESYDVADDEVTESYEDTSYVSDSDDTESVSSIEGDYGPTTADDTLWSIATQMRPDSSVSVQQMMLALLRANPEAFLDNNINGLKRGQILRMPSQDDIDNYSKSEALEETKSQYSLWEDARGALASTTTERAESSGISDSYLDSDYESDSISEEVEDGGELRLVAASDGGTASGQFDSDSAGGENLALANEQLEAISQENRDLRDRMAEAETIINDLKRLIALKDDELAAMQQQLSGATPAEDVELADEFDTEEIQEEFADADVEASEDEEEIYAEEEGGFDEELASVDEEFVAEDEEDAAAVEEEIEEEVVAEEATAPVVEEAYVPPPPAGIVDQAMSFLMDNMIMLAGALGGLLLIIGAVVFLIKRKRSAGDETVAPVAEATEFPDFSGEAEETDMPSADAAADADEIDSEAETGLAEAVDEEEEEGDKTEFVAPGEAAEPEPEPEEPEEDPLAEVNVFLAYEHFEQAEEFVRDAITGEPENLDFHSKLLEVFYAAGNKQGYEEEARVLNDLVGGEGPHWDMALAMWAEMSPNRALFAEPVAGEEEVADTGGGGIVDLTADEGAAPAADDAGLDFDLGAGDAEEPAEPAGGDDSEDVLDITAGGDEDVLDVTASTGEEDILDVTAAIATEDVDGEDLLDVTAAVGLDTDSEQAAEEAPSDTAAEEEMLDITGGAGAEEDMLDITGGGAAEDDLLDVTGHTDLGGDDLEEDLLDVTSATSAGADSDALLEVADEPATADEPAAEEDNALDFDIGGAEPEPAAEEPAEDDSSLDFDIGGVEAETADEPDVSESDGDADNVIDFDAALSSDAESDDSEEEALDLDIGGDELPELDIEADAGGDDEISLDAGAEDSLEVDLSADDSDDGESLDLDIEVPESTGDDLDGGLEIDISDSGDDDLSLDIEMDDAGDADSGAELDLSIDDDSESETLEVSLDDAAGDVPELDMGDDDLSIDLEIDAEDDAVPSLEVADDTADDGVPEIELDMDGTVEMPNIDLDEDDDDDDDDDDDHTVFVPRSSDASEQTADDEIATKLDLAKAYVELGDKDSAKSILDEVIADGNDAQKQQAQELLNQV